MQIQIRYREADTANAVTMLESERYSLFVFRSEIATVEVVDYEAKGRRMRQHVRHRRSVRANETETEIRRRADDDVPPSPASVCELVPPAFADPFPALQGTKIVTLVFIYKIWPTEIKYVEKRVIVEDVNGCIVWSATGTGRCYKQIDMIEEGVPLMFGVATRYSWAD